MAMHLSRRMWPFKNAALCAEPNLQSKSHMEQIEVLYTQALARIDLNVGNSGSLDRGPGSNHKKKKTGPSEQRIRPPLREQINIRHTGVVDITPSDFWLKHPESIIIFIVGDIHRDRIDDKSCVFLYFMELMKYFPHRSIALRIRTEVETQMIHLSSTDFNIAVKQVDKKLFLFQRQSHITLYYEDPTAELIGAKHFILCAAGLFDDPRSIKPHFSSSQCFVDVSSTIINFGPQSFETGLPQSLLNPATFALVGVLGALSNFPQTGKYLKTAFRLHACGSGRDERGYQFGYQKLTEHAKGWCAIHKHQYQEREGLKAKSVNRMGIESHSGTASLRRRPLRVCRNARPRHLTSATQGIIDRNYTTPEVDLEEGSASSNTSPIFPELSATDTTPHAEPDIVELIIQDAPASASVETIDSASSSVITMNPQATSIAISFVGLGMLFDLCQQSPRPPWKMPLSFKQQPLPIYQNNRAYVIHHIFFDGYHLEGVRLFQVREKAPGANSKLCPYGCLNLNETGHRFPGGTCPLVRHLSPAPWDGKCSKYPLSFEMSAVKELHMPLSCRGGLDVYYRKTDRSTGYYTSMFVLAGAMFALAKGIVENDDSDRLVTWRQFRAERNESTAKAMLAEYFGS